MCQSQSVGSYEQAGKVSRMELQKGHWGLCRRAKRAFFLGFSRDCHIGLWLDQTQTVMVMVSHFIALGPWQLELQETYNDDRMQLASQNKTSLSRAATSLSSFSAICTSVSHPNPAIGWDGICVGFDFQLNIKRAREQMWLTAARPNTNLVWQCHTVPVPKN